MKLITVSVLAIVVLFGIVLSAEMPQVVYIHYSTLEEAEEAQKKILAEYEGATIIMGDDPLLSVANITSSLNEMSDISTTSEKTEDKEDDSKVVSTSSTSTTTTSTTTTSDSTTEASDGDKDKQ